MSNEQSSTNRELLFEVLREAAGEPPEDYVPGTAAPPAVNPAGLPPREPFARLDQLDAARAWGPSTGVASGPRGSAVALEGADLIEAEARAQGSAQALARGLVLASELWALSGDHDRALECARDAFQASPKFSIGGTQLRALAREQGDLEPLATTLESEARLSASESARAHAALLLSDVLRFQENDPARASRAADLAHRLSPDDLRALLPRLAERLGSGENPGLVPLPKDSPLRAAAQRLAELRSGREAPEPSVTLLLNRAREKLRQGDIEGAGQALLVAADSKIDELSLLDVAASLLAHTSAGRPRAIAALKRRVGKSPSRAALRTLAARAVEQGDGAALSYALDLADPASGTFDLADRVMLAMALGGRVDLGEVDLDVLSSQSHPAFSAALAPSARASASSSPEALDSSLGSALASGERREALPLALEQLDASDALRAVLEAELGAATGNAEQTTRALGELAQTLDAPELLAACGILHELDGRTENARAAYAQALAAQPDALWLARAVSETSSDAHAVRELKQRGESERDPKRAALLFVEAALRADAGEKEQLLRRAHEIDGAEPLVPRLGSLLAARSGDESAHADWLSLCRALASQNERSLLTLREALARRQQDAGAAATLVQDVRSRHKSDYCLAELRERFTDTPDRERALSRIGIEPKSPEDATWLLSEATWLAWHAEDAETAAQAARALADKTPGGSAGELAELLELESGNLTRLNDRLLEATRDDSDPARQRAAFEALSRIDEGRGNPTSAMLWQRALLEKTPGHMPALRYIEHQLITGKREAEWEDVAADLARNLPAEDGAAYSLLLGTQELTLGDHQKARSWLEPLATREPAPLLSVRAMQTLARANKDFETIAKLSARIARAAHQPADAVTSYLRAAEAAAALGRPHEAKSFVQKALERRPDDLVALWLRAEALSADLSRNKKADPAPVAEAYEALAHASRVAEHKALAFLEAGDLWKRAKNAERAAAAFERTLATDPQNVTAFTELRALRAEDPAALVELLEARRGFVSVTADRLELDRARAEAYGALGDSARRREALEAVLEASPKNEAALSAHAEVCTELEDHEAARGSLSSLLEVTKNAATRGVALRALGGLLQDHLNDLRGAAAAYEEALRATPDDLEVSERLVRAYVKLGDAERSTNLQTRIIQLVATPEEKRDGALLLAQIYEHVGRDPKRAAATLERTRKAWPLDPDALAATARFMDRQGDRGARRILVDRTGKDAFRKLEEGRIDPALLELLATVADLQGREDQAAATRAVRAAFLGEEEELVGAHSAALDPKLDNMLAPAGMSQPLRTLLRKTAAALDAAFPVDLRALAARPLDPGDLATHIAVLSRDAGLGKVEVFVADALGARSLPVASSPQPGAPHRLVVGPGIEALDEAARDFLLLRAMKLQQAGVGAFARSRAEDTWPMLAALLMLFAPNWRPADADARKMTLARTQIERGLSVTGYDDDVPVLVLEAIGGAGGQLSHLGEAGRLVANRAALLGVGSPSAALRAFSSLSDKPLPESGVPRQRWISGHTEARELLLFSASDAYAEARMRTGLAPEATRHSEPPRPPMPTMAGGPRPPMPSMVGAPRPPMPSIGGAGAPQAPAPQAPRPPQPSLSGEAPPPPRRGAPPPPKRS